MLNNLIWVVNKSEIAQSALDLLVQAGYKIIFDLSQPDLSKVIGIFVRTHTIVDDKILTQLTGLRFVLKAGVGLDNIDVKACQARGIDVFNSPGSNASSVAEYVVSNMITSLRKFKTHEELLRSGSWRSYDQMGVESAKKVVGLLGYGAVGKEVARKLSNFDVKIFAYDPYLSQDQIDSPEVQLVSLDYLISISEVISIQMPLTTETKDLINDRLISQMKQGVVLINVSRGELIDEAALIKYSHSGKFGGLVLDVFCNEPHINPALSTLENTILTPHIAGFTFEANERMSLIAATNMLNKYNQRIK